MSGQEFESSNIYHKIHVHFFGYSSLKDIIPNNTLREDALKKTMDFGEEFKFLQGQKEITVTHDGMSIHIKEIDIEAKANVGHSSVIEDAGLTGSIGNIVKTETFDMQAQKLSTSGTSVNKPSIFELDNTTLHHARIEQFGKNGLPLLYSLSSMSNDLHKYINSLPPSEKFAIFKKFNLKFVNTHNGNVLADIPNLSAEVTTEAQKKVLEILTKYTKQNSIIINPPNLKKELEDFINGVPEFMFMIGKPQNGSHFGSLDVHTLSVLDKALKYADDAHLSNEQKDILKMVVMLHDMGKQFKGVSVSDTGHAALSKQYAQQILDRFNYSQEVKDRILNLIDNHHWFKDYNNGTISADEVVAMFGNDLEIAKVFAKADLESVNDNFHINKLGASSEADYQVKMQEKLDAINGTSTSTAPNVDVQLIGLELPYGELKLTGYDGQYLDYVLDVSKIDAIQIGNVNIDFNDPKLKQLMTNLKVGESFAIGCTNPKTNYTDVKYQIGKYEDGVGSHHLIITKKGSEFTISAHKSANVIKKGTFDYQKKIAQGIQTKIADIKNKAYKVETQTFKIKGKDVTFDVYYGSKDGGSNNGYYVVNKATGELFYAKESSGSFQYKAEVAATKLYSAAGIEAPDVEIITLPNGKKGMISKYIPELKPLTEPNVLAYDGFGMDVLLENWDSVGLSFDNTLITSDGSHVIKLDAGGSFDYKAQGGPKAFTSIPMELITMLDPYMNHTASQIYGKMSRADFIKSLEKAVNLSNANINNILSECGCPQYAYTLKQRKAF